MKYLLALCGAFLIISCGEKSSKPSAASQQTVIHDSTLLKKEVPNPYEPVDVSPMDMVYFPTDFPIKKMSNQVSGMPVMRIVYSRPHRGGRKLFGGLVQWGQLWRLGANEATEIEFFQPVSIQNKKIEKGRYILYAVPYENHWTIVLNKNVFSWGLKLDPAEDLARFDAPSTSRSPLVEYFTMAFEKNATGADLIMVWENTEVRLPIQF